MLLFGIRGSTRISFSCQCCPICVNMGAALLGLDPSRMLKNPPTHRNGCLCIIHSLRHAHRAGYCCFCETLHGTLGDSLELLQTLAPTETCQRCHASGMGSVPVVQGPPGTALLSIVFWSKLQYLSK